ncbi:MAG: HAD hydrolase-like protein [Bacteroidales bacterium]|nr:HAD hydrolase-like protein [Bacteroidales bacterium]
MKTELQKCLDGEIFNTSDKEIQRFIHHARKLSNSYNSTPSNNSKKRNEILSELFGEIGNNVNIDTPFYCDYGRHIFIGSNVIININCTFVDCNKIEIGNNVLIASNVQIYTSTHSTKVNERLVENWNPNSGLPYFRTYALLVKIDDNVWIGGGVIILPGVTIGENSVIGAGSVVTKSIPTNCVAVGNPCRVIRKIKEKPKNKRRIKAIIFDLDGTLGNTIPLCLEAFRRTLEPLIGKTISNEEIIATFGPSEEGTIKAFIPEKYNQGISDYLYYYEKLHKKWPKPFDGILSLLSELKQRDISIAMVTGKGKQSTNITLQKFGIRHLFEKIETGHIKGARKPEGIKAIIDFFHDLDKNEMIYVGDAPNDIIACNQVGIPVIAAAWGETAEPERLAELKPDEIFYSIDDFTNWINSNI